MHHSDKSFPLDIDPKGTPNNIGKIFQNSLLGATGKFPEGKINDTDQGEIMCAIGIEKNKVLFSFVAKPIAWIAFSKEQAILIAESLTKFANELN